MIMQLKPISQAVLVSLGLAVATFSASHAGAQAPDPVAVSHHTEAVSSAPVAEDSLNVNLAAGATLNGGNSESYAANGGGRLVLVRQPHQLTIEALGTLAYSKDQNPPHHVNRTAGAAIGRARYDLYLTRMDALFLALQPRRDLYAGLQLRLQNQAGYLRNLYFPADGHRLWTELGYDLTYDKYEAISKTTQVSSAPGPGVGDTTTITHTDPGTAGHAFVHSGRVFLGYTNQLHPVATVNLGVETLYDVKDKKDVRVNGTAELNSTLSARFKLGVQFRILFDNQPVPNTLKKYDTITAVQLIYSYDSLAGKTAPACPACDCSAEVAAAKASCPGQVLVPEGSALPATPEPAVPAEASEPAAAEQQPSLPVSAGATP
jgi:putative salt-induced outer membrane protein YdiY